jgi:hypothetical protein
MSAKQTTVVSLLIGLTAVVALSSCASNLYPGGPSVAGMIYTGVKDPAQNLSVAVDTGAQGMKVGTSSASAFLGLIAFGDASIDAAMKAGGITKVHHVDHEVQLVLMGLWSSATTIVHGE